MKLLALTHGPVLARLSTSIPPGIVPTALVTVSKTLLKHGPRCVEFELNTGWPLVLTTRTCKLPGATLNRTRLPNPRSRGPLLIPPRSLRSSSLRCLPLIRLVTFLIRLALVAIPLGRGRDPILGPSAPLGVRAGALFRLTTHGALSLEKLIGLPKQLVTVTPRLGAVADNSYNIRKNVTTVAVKLVKVTPYVLLRRLLVTCPTCPTTTGRPPLTIQCL